MRGTNHFFRAIGVVILAISDIALAIFGWLILCVILFICKAEALYDAFLSFGFYVYFVITFLIMLRNSWHRVKWYVKTYPIKIRCHKCHTIVPLTRYNEEEYLKSPISLCFPRPNQAFRFVGYKVLYYKIAYRPYLQLECPKCGEKQVICPYCHESIPQKLVECKYDKPSVCPHCGKKIYTPVPMREWENGIYVGDILD